MRSAGGPSRERWVPCCPRPMMNPVSLELLSFYRLAVATFSQNMFRKSLETCFWHMLQHRLYFPTTWWRHQMEIFSALLALCAGNSPVTGEFPSQRPVTRSFDVFFDLCLNKRLSKQWWGWWFETPLRPLCRHCNEMFRRATQAENKPNKIDEFYKNKIQQIRVDIHFSI